MATQRKPLAMLKTHKDLTRTDKVLAAVKDMAAAMGVRADVNTRAGLRKAIKTLDEAQRSARGVRSVLREFPLGRRLLDSSGSKPTAPLPGIAQGSTAFDVAERLKMFKFATEIDSSLMKPLAARGQGLRSQSPADATVNSQVAPNVPRGPVNPELLAGTSAKTSVPPPVQSSSPTAPSPAAAGGVPSVQGSPPASPALSPAAPASPQRFSHPDVVAAMLQHGDAYNTVVKKQLTTLYPDAPASQSLAPATPLAVGQGVVSGIDTATRRRNAENQILSLGGSIQPDPKTKTIDPTNPEWIKRFANMTHAEYAATRKGLGADARILDQFDALNRPAFKNQQDYIKYLGPLVKPDVVSLTSADGQTTNDINVDNPNIYYGRQLGIPQSAWTGSDDWQNYTEGHRRLAGILQAKVKTMMGQPQATENAGAGAVSPIGAHQQTLAAALGGRIASYNGGNDITGIPDHAAFQMFGHLTDARKRDLMDQGMPEAEAAKSAQNWRNAIIANTSKTQGLRQNARDDAHSLGVHLFGQKEHALAKKLERAGVDLSTASAMGDLASGKTLSPEQMQALNVVFQMGNVPQDAIPVLNKLQQDPKTFAGIVSMAKKFTDKGPEGVKQLGGFLTAMKTDGAMDLLSSYGELTSAKTPEETSAAQTKFGGALTALVAANDKLIPAIEPFMKNTLGLNGSGDLIKGLLAASKAYPNGGPELDAARQKLFSAALAQNPQFEEQLLEAKFPGRSKEMKPILDTLSAAAQKDPKAPFAKVVVNSVMNDPAMKPLRDEMPGAAMAGIGGALGGIGEFLQNIFGGFMDMLNPAKMQEVFSGLGKPGGIMKLLPYLAGGAALFSLVNALTKKDSGIGDYLLPLLLAGGAGWANTRGGQDTVQGLTGERPPEAERAAEVARQAGLSFYPSPDKVRPQPAGKPVV